MSKENTFWAEQYREYLRLLGTTQLSPELLGKLDLSGVIQVTMLDACESDATEITTEKDQRVWLRRVFLNNLLDELRKLRARKRDVGRERSLDASINESASRLNAILANDGSTPSVKAGRVEQAEFLLQAIAALPPLQRQAIELHHLQEMPLEEISRIMNRPKGAVAALIYRGMKTLKASKVLLDYDSLA
ncbi:RNA polymerase sigma factor [Aporhodopirellula aestuarii]|uniref:Sigma-70 family RNA polymerase sigma factor n=1 Tax=Aporhodopirellula aestuarii TaxID=2950107 RepID=A0ABT0U6A3_9BACT|nr:sigma-70 family RNA polymerase sigma factor [Aporhodopirellula aestuarii]MCM2372332.1 sigma-70 family RNA polymerase sigma factor [Aporhodopirellula aestuarii]